MIFRNVVIVFALVCLGVATPLYANPLETLRPGHPRVLATAEDFARIARLVETDPRAKQWHAELIEEGEAMLDEPVVEYNLRDGRRLLYESRLVVDRVLTLGLLDALSNDDRYRDRIWADLEAAAGFKDWNPDHYLDVAEMAFAFGLAYDWLYDRWTPAQRKIIREAIVKHGLNSAFRAYENNTWWTRTHINWNQVCNGSLIVAALAIAEESPEEAGRMVRLAVEALKIPMKRYAPDGGYQEGPGYWHYGTIYNVIALASLESALGADFGLGQMPGFSRTGDFPRHMTGPSGDSYNFGDNSAKPVRSPAMFYLAKRFDQPGTAVAAAELLNASPLALLWYDPKGLTTDTTDLPLDAVYHSAGAASMRSSWTDPDAWFVAAKGGWIGFGHSQMDLGSFILEQGGVRWFIDLGSDNYNLPGYFHSNEGDGRWAFYRNRAEGHNTLVLNPPSAPPAEHGDQPYDAVAPIKLKDKAIDIDLSEVYGEGSRRTIKLDVDNSRTTVVDALSLDEPGEVWWFAHTKAMIEVAEDGRSAVLRQDGNAMCVSIHSPITAKFSVMAARPMPGSPDPAGQNPNNGAELVNTAPGSRHTKRGEVPRFGKPDPANTVKKLAIRLEGVTQTRLEVRFEPVQE